MLKFISKYIYLVSCLLTCILLSCQKKDLVIESVSVYQFKNFIIETGYITDAEKYGWSIVQIDVYNYKIVNGANWGFPNGKDKSVANHPVTQVSYNDAIAYCKWADVKLPTYEEYWKIVANDKRKIVFDNKFPISPTNSVNVVGNVWDITEPINYPKIRLAGGSLFCSESTCHGTQKDRELYVDPETGNYNVGFSVLK